jgi:hypothetical protein
MKACGFTKPGAGAAPVAKHPFELDIGDSSQASGRVSKDSNQSPRASKSPVVPQYPPLINLYPCVIDPAPEIERHDGLARLVIGGGVTLIYVLVLHSRLGSASVQLWQPVAQWRAPPICIEEGMVRHEISQACNGS